MSSFARLIAATALLCLTLSAPAQDLLKAYSPRVDAPAFDLEGADGQRYKLSDFRGKVLVVNFWATWCPPCRKEMPSMQRMWRALQDDGVELVAIDFGDEKALVQEFAEETAIEFPLLLDQKGTILHAFEAIGLPTTYVIDRAGKLAYVAAGEREWDAPNILAALRKLAKADATQ